MQLWASYLLPLPHEIRIADSVRCKPGEVSIALRDQAGPIEQQGAAELEALFVEKGKAKPDGGAFTIDIGVAPANSAAIERLQSLKNKAQAYLIEPRGRDGLVLTGLDERGVYYACQTLIQLLEPEMSSEQVHIPLAEVIDWPDMDERGLWNFPEPATWIPWLATLKLNYGKMASTQLHPIERGQCNRATIDREQFEAARQRAFNYLPYILHLNFLHDCGLFRAYPELAGKGDSALTGRYFAHKTGNQHRAPCASQPLLVQIIQEWMEDIAEQGAEEISCWLSERPGQCGCLECTAVGQFVLESRAFVAAWRQAQERYPNLQIRIFLSTTTTVRNYRVLDELPPEVKIERACATELERVLHRPRDLMANPLLDHYAAEGRWIASYDVPIAANGKVDTPEFKVPQRSAHRMRDYVGQLVRRGYSGAYAMMAWGGPERQICSFNIHALAEWAWNMQGRDETEFALAWARREGYAQPEVVAEWADLDGAGGIRRVRFRFPDMLFLGQGRGDGAAAAATLFGRGDVPLLSQCRGLRRQSCGLRSGLGDCRGPWGSGFGPRDAGGAILCGTGARRLLGRRTDGYARFRGYGKPSAGARQSRSVAKDGPK